LSELVVIGGGPAGVTAALRARELGAEVILIEREKLGGTCTNDGCVPTRALAKAARLVRDAEQFADYGLRGLAPRVDFSGVLLSARRVVEEVHDKKRLRERLEAAGVEVLTYDGDELSRKGDGGPTCLTRPLLRG
jgi:pyruvate/2-oxoglutarate dehydrogenase complex dihydrolipoamide dehydrogenase (E3) component